MNKKIKFENTVEKREHIFKLKIFFLVFFFFQHSLFANTIVYFSPGDMGGEIGIMLGASLLTFVEFMDLLIFFVYHQLLRI